MGLSSSLAELDLGVTSPVEIGFAYLARIWRQI
jgi:hypothetical protein